MNLIETLKSVVGVKPCSPRYVCLYCHMSFVGQLEGCPHCGKTMLVPYQEPEPPRFTHDCGDCIWMGPQVGTEGEVYDGWFCRSGMLGGSVILRYGSEGPEYMSAPLKVAINIVGPLGELAAKIMRFGFGKENT